MTRTYGSNPYSDGSYSTAVPGQETYGNDPYGSHRYSGRPARYPDALPDIRFWLRNHHYLKDLSQGRVFFSIPPSVKKAPFIRIYRSGGGPQSENEAPIMDLRLGVETWGMAGADYEAVRQTALAIEQAAHDFDPGTVLGPNGTVGQNINPTTAMDSPDPDTGWPRIVLDVVFTVRSS